MLTVRCTSTEPISTNIPNTTHTPTRLLRKNNNEPTYPHCQRHSKDMEQFDGALSAPLSMTSEGNHTTLSTRHAVMFPNNRCTRHVWQGLGKAPRHTAQGHAPKCHTKTSEGNHTTLCTRHAVMFPSNRHTRHLWQGLGEAPRHTAQGHAPKCHTKTSEGNHTTLRQARPICPTKNNSPPNQWSRLKEVACCSCSAKTRQGTP